MNHDSIEVKIDGEAIRDALAPPSRPLPPCLRRLPRAFLVNASRNAKVTINFKGDRPPLTTGGVFIARLVHEGNVMLEAVEAGIVFGVPIENFMRDFRPRSL
jgi:hypothetical protein